MELTGLKGGRDRMKSRMMSWASLLTFGGILPSTNTGFNLYLNANNRSYSPQVDDHYIIKPRYI